MVSSGRSRLMRHHPFLIHRVSEKAHSRKLRAREGRERAEVVRPRLFVRLSGSAPLLAYQLRSVVSAEHLIPLASAGNKLLAVTVWCRRGPCLANNTVMRIPA